MHFLRKSELVGPRRFDLERAAVRVATDGRDRLVLVEGSGIIVVRPDAYWVELPARVEIFVNTVRLKRQAGFVRIVTVETIDPFHLVADVRAEDWGR